METNTVTPPAAGEPSLARELSGKSLETFIFRVLAQAAAAGMGIAIARLLGPSGKGLFAYSTAAGGILIALASGQSAAISWQYGRLKTAPGAVFKVMMAYFYVLVLPVSLGVVIAGLVRHEVPLVAAGAIFPFSYFNQLTLAFFLSDGSVRWQNVQGLAIAASQAIAVTIACFLFRDRIDLVFAGWIIPQVLTMFFSSANVRRYARRTDPSIDLKRLFWRQVTFAMRAGLNQMVWSLNFQVDIFIILYVLGAKSAGIYSVAVAIGQLMWFISRPLASSSLGKVSSGTKSEAAYVTAVCLKHALLAVTVCCAVLFFIGPPLLHAVYGPKFEASGIALRWILPGIIAYCAVPFFGQFFILQMGRPTVMTIIGSISTVVCAVITLLLVRHLGIVAGAMGTSVSYIVSFAIMVVLFCRRTGIDPRLIFIVTRADLRHYRVLAETTFARVFQLVMPRSA